VARGICLALFCAVLPASARASSWEFDRPDDGRAWSGDGIAGAGVVGGSFRFWAQNQAVVFLPGRAGPEDRYLRIRFRAFSPRLAGAFFQGPGRPPEVLGEGTAVRDRRFHTVWFPLPPGAAEGVPGRLGLFFNGAPGWVELDSVEIRPFSLPAYLSDGWREFMAPRPLHPGTVNSLNSPVLYGLPLIDWALAAAALAVLIGILCSIARVRSGAGVRAVVIRTAAVLGAVWVLYDLREMYGMVELAGEVNRQFAAPPAREKNYPGLGDFYRLVDFAREHIPRDASYHFYQGWPYDCRLIYYLYPRRLNCDTAANIVPGENIRYHLMYDNPEIVPDPVSRRLRLVGPGAPVFISGPGRVVARMDENTYVFREDDE